MTHTFKSIALVGLLLVAALSSMVPTAAAQDPTKPAESRITLAIAPVDAPIKPLSGIATSKITGKLTYLSAGVALVPTQINLKVEDKPGWVVATVSPSTLQLTGSAPGGQQVVIDWSANVIIYTLAEAPAFTPAEIRISATALPNSNIAGSSTTEPVTVTADFFSMIDAQLTNAIQLAKPQQQVSYPITVKNLGNADTKVFFDIVSKPDNFEVLPPPPIILESKQKGGKTTQQEVFLTIQTPYKNGYMNSVGAVILKIRSNYALEATKIGDSTQLSVLTTTKGFYVPGPDAAFFVIALGLVAVALGGRRRSA